MDVCNACDFINHYTAHELCTVHLAPQRPFDSISTAAYPALLSWRRCQTRTAQFLRPSTLHESRIGHQSAPLGRQVVLRLGSISRKLYHFQVFLTRCNFPVSDYTVVSSGRQIWTRKRSYSKKVERNRSFKSVANLRFPLCDQDVLFDGFVLRKKSSVSWEIRTTKWINVVPDVFSEYPNQLLLRSKGRP